ncbi:MAG: hypothetical protein ACYDA2_07170 [Acidimicrobiales bacterium]
MAVVLECADPGGKAANLPTDDSECDGATQYPKTVLFGHDGSARIPDYQLFELPNAALGEQSNAALVCGTRADPCVLYVGLDQNDFTQPKVFSAPFYFSGPPEVPFRSAAATPAAPATAPASVGGSPTPPPSGPSLAFTGPSSGIVGVAGTGVLLAAGGTVLRRRLRRG